MTKHRIAGAFLLAATIGTAAWAQHDGHAHRPTAAHGSHRPASAADTRQLVNFPDPLRRHTLANMRDHLAVLGDLQALLGAGAFDKASDLAEARLGLSSLRLHGAHDVARYMPQGMQDAGGAMHRAASRFARVATDASVTGSLKEPLEALADVSRTCVACHAGYRLH